MGTAKRSMVFITGPCVRSPWRMASKAVRPLTLSMSPPTMVHRAESLGAFSMCSLVVLIRPVAEA